MKTRKMTFQTERHGPLTLDVPEVDYVEAWQSKIALKLMELGILPTGVQDFEIKVPMQGPISITCTFQVDGRFDDAIKDFENYASGTTSETDSDKNS